MILYGSLLLCTLLGAALVYRYDMYNREPWFMVVAAVGLGMLVMWPMAAVEMASFEALGLADRPVLGLALVAGTHEEAARLLAVVVLALVGSRHFDDPMDGLIYGSLVGLGMALQESLGFLVAEEADGVLPASEPVRLAGHLVMGGITAVGVGMARLGLPRWPIWLVATVAGSIALHVAWDLIALDAFVHGRMERWQTVAAVGLMLAGLFAYGVLVVLASDWSRAVFAPHDARRLWGWPFTMWMR